jgi:hypothetical protein
MSNTDTTPRRRGEPRPSRPPGAKQKATVTRTELGTVNDRLISGKT